MKSAPALRLLPLLTAALAARRLRIETILARSETLSSPAVLHDLRVALRRTAAVARLTRNFPARGDGEALRMAARDLRRALSGSRTREVTLRRLRERFRRDASKRRTAEKLADRLRRDARDAPAAKTADSRLSDLRRAFAWRDADLARVNPSLSGLLDARVEKTLRRAIRRRLRRRQKKLLDAGIPTAESLHPLRIAAKDLRYGLELFAGALPDAPRVLRALEAFQETAGDAHDRAELIAEVRHASGECPPPLRRQALRLLPVLLGDAERSLARAQRASRRLLVALKKAKFDFE